MNMKIWSITSIGIPFMPKLKDGMPIHQYYSQRRLSGNPATQKGALELARSVSTARTLTDIAKASSSM